MNDTMVKERARERLLDAELAEVVAAAPRRHEHEASPRPGATTPRWTRAALVLLGVTVAVAVQLATAEPERAAQEPFAHDPLRPAWKVWEAAVRTGREVASVRELGDLPAATPSITVRAGAPADVVARALARPALRHLTLRGDADGVPWHAFDQHAQLRSLSLPNGCAPEQVRALRRLPDLLAIALGDADLDAAMGAALAELPKLRVVMATRHHEPAGLRALAALPDLESLILGVQLAFRPDPAALRPLAALTRLRALSLVSEAGGTLTRPMVEELAKLPELRVLDLAFVDVDDETLAALPDDLHALSLPQLTATSARALSGLRRMTRLKSLEFRGRVPHAAARAELVEALELTRLDTGGPPDDALWRVLANAPTLQQLVLDFRRDQVGDRLGPCAGLTKLRELDVRGDHLPTLDALAPLFGLDGLRVLRLRTDVRPRTPGPSRAAIDELDAALRERLGDRVQVEFLPF